MNLGTTWYIAAFALLALLAMRVYFDPVHSSRPSRLGWSLASALLFPIGFIAFMVYRYTIHPASRVLRSANPTAQG